MLALYSVQVQQQAICFIQASCNFRQRAESFTNNVECNNVESFWSFDRELKHSELDPKFTSSFVLMAENMEKMDD